MRDKRDARGKGERNSRCLRGFCLKSLLTLMTLLTLFIANAQGLQSRTFLNSPARQTTLQTSQTSSAASASNSTQTFQVDGTLDDLLFFYCCLTNVQKTVIRDPSIEPELKKQFVFRPSPTQILDEDDKKVICETLLEMNGIHLEPYGERFIRAVARKIARKEGIPLVLEDAKFDDLGTVVSTIFSFKVISVDVAEKILKEFLSDKSGPMQVFKHTNSILVTDTMQNVNRMREIMKEIDRKLPPTKVEGEWFLYKLNYATADNIEKALQAAYDYDKKRVEEMNKALETPEKAAPTGSGGAPQSARPGRLLGNLVRDAASQAASKPADSVVAGSSPYVVGMLPTMPLFIYDIENSPDRLVVYTTKEEKKVYDEIVEKLDVPAIPDKVVKVYRLKYAEAEDVANMINDLINKSSGSRSKNDGKKTSSTTTAKSAQQKQARPATKQQQGDGKVGELTPDNTQVLSDKRINGLVVQTLRTLVPTIEQIIESMDIKLSQVLIETVIIEVGLGDDLSTGIDWVNNNWTGEDPTVLGGGGGGGNSGTLSAITDGGKTWAEYLKDAQAIIGDVGDSQYGGASYSDKQTAIEKMAKSLQEAALNELTVKPVGTGLNYYLKSDKLNISAVISASKTDSHSKYIASPVIMTLDNKEAEIKATEMRYLFKGYTYSGSTYNGSAVPDYEQKELGITIKTTPKINPNGTVMLTIEEEYSQEGNGQAITAANGTDKISAATTITRKMSADALLENGQTVVFGGLTETKKGEKTGGIPILKDIPIIGKWLFGYVEESEARKELLVFMTPYVLDDAQAAQAEALRRKKAISDTRPWDDHGWSASALADPVSKQEQMRRIKDQWRVQDEERRTRIAIEKEKVNRVKKLQEMSKDEREMWLKMHKAELDAEAQDELEEKMLDEKSQEGLKKLAAEIRAKKLDAAEKAIKQDEEETSAENERGKLDAAKKAKEEAK